MNFSMVILCSFLTTIIGLSYSFPSLSLLDLMKKSKFIDLLEERALQQYLNDNQYMSLENIPNRIIGGVDAASGEAPYYMQLFRGFLFSNRFICGGSLITSRTVLTAAHCISYFYNYRVRYGSNSRLWSPYADVEVKSIKPHPEFNLITVQNDISLLILKKPITPGSNVDMIELATSGFVKGTNVTLFGFGLTQGNEKEASLKMQKTNLFIMDENECAEHISKLNMEKSPGMFCASAPYRSACNGDSGGPLVENYSQRQIGIVSYGTRSCPPGSINVYTNVSYYNDWINENKVE